MTSFDLTPIGHVPPRKPIDLRPVWPSTPREPWEEQIDEIARANALARGERIWKLVKQCAEGTNVSSRPVDDGMPLDGAGEAQDSFCAAGAMPEPEITTGVLIGSASWLPSRHVSDGIVWRRADANFEVVMPEGWNYDPVSQAWIRSRPSDQQTSTTEG